MKFLNNKSVLLMLLCFLSAVRGQDEEDKDDNVGLAFLLVTFAGMSTSIGAAFVFCDKAVSQDNYIFLGAALGFAGGIMIYIALVEILQESFADFGACNCLWDADDLEEGEESGAAILMGTLMFFLGVIIVYVLDFVVHKIYEGADSPLAMPAPVRTLGEIIEREETEKNDSAPIPTDRPGSHPANSLSGLELEAGAVDGETEEEVEVKRKLRQMGILTAIALGLHNFPEGLATFAGTLEDPAVGVALAFAIAIHNIPEGLCVAIPIYYATGSRWQGFWIAFASGLAEIVGALLGYLFLEEILGAAAFGIVFGVVAGMMTTIVLRELLPTALRYDPEDKYVTNAIFIGAGVMAFSIILFEL